MKTIGRFAIPVLLAIAVVIGAGNQVMAQMTALAGEEYAPVLAVEYSGAESYVMIMGQRWDFDTAMVQNAIDQIKSTIQSAVEGVKYGIDRQ